jgi:hypothetical protein
MYSRILTAQLQRFILMLSFQLIYTIYFPALILSQTCRLRKLTVLKKSGRFTPIMYGYKISVTSMLILVSCHVHLSIFTSKLFYFGQN